MSKFNVKLLTKTAQKPTKGSDKSAGYDLYADNAEEDIVILAHGKALIKTGIAMKIPDNYYGRIAPRSGLAWKSFIDVGAGVIDGDYRGEVGVVLYNFSDQDFKVKYKDRIAQLILTHYVTPEIEIVDDLDATDRGAGGYGSTGVSSK